MAEHDTRGGFLRPLRQWLGIVADDPQTERLVTHMEIITREAVGLVPPKPGMDPMAVSSVHKIIAHHSDEPPPTDPHSGHDQAHDAAAGQVRSIQAFHMNTRGYDDIAYHFLIAPDGAVYEGREVQWVGAHAGRECNRGTLGVCFLMVDVLTDAAKEAFNDLRDELHSKGFDVHEVEPHSDCNPTQCPGDTDRAWIRDGCPRPHDQPHPPSPHTLPCNSLEPGPPPHGLPLLREGATGNVVRLVQQRLLELGHPPTHSRKADGSWDGQFGPGTLAAVVAAQQGAHVQADGVVGRQTWCVLGVR